ncbi:MAG TPA: hypothetical protein VFX76_04965, partial [Roseiflexaceae bacterium]|nr:hypothetical protein [Roseiflexaceae bacterium]
KNCAFVDDLPENIEGARAVGMYGILLDRQNMHSSTQLTRVASLGHLAELLESGWVLFPE